MYQLLSSCSSGDTRVKQPSDHISALLEVVHVLHVYRRWFCIIFSKQLLAELLRPEQANIFVVMFQQRSGNFLSLSFSALAGVPRFLYRRYHLDDSHLHRTVSL